MGIVAQSAVGRAWGLAGLVKAGPSLAADPIQLLWG